MESPSVKPEGAKRFRTHLSSICITTVSCYFSLQNNATGCNEQIAKLSATLRPKPASQEGSRKRLVEQPLLQAAVSPSQTMKPLVLGLTKDASGIFLPPPASQEGSPFTVAAWSLLVTSWSQYRYIRNNSWLAVQRRTTQELDQRCVGLAKTQCKPRIFALEYLQWSV